MSKLALIVVATLIAPVIAFAVPATPSPISLCKTDASGEECIQMAEPSNGAAPPQIAVSVSAGTTLPATGSTAIAITFTSGTPATVTLARGSESQFAQWPTGNLSQYFTRTSTGLTFDFCLSCVPQGNLTLGVTGTYAGGQTVSAQTTVTIGSATPAPVPASTPTPTPTPIPAQTSSASCTHYVSPAGSDSNSGTNTAASWRTFAKAASSAQAGDVVCFRAGIYSEYVTLSNSGTVNSRITFQNYPGETPVIDGSGRPGDTAGTWSASDDLINVYGNYITIRGLELKNFASFGIYVRGNYATIDSVHAHNGYRAGVYFYMSSYGTAINNLVHDIYDYGPGGTGGGGNADCMGSSASNSPGAVYGYHTFKNNVVYNCADDGIDTWTSQYNTIEGNIAHHAGYSNASNGGSKSIGQPVGNGNGFKLGKGGNNTVRNNIAYSNLTSGFDDNSGSGNQLFNNTAYNTGAGFNIYTSGNILKNNLSYGGSNNLSGSPTQNNNSWNLGVTNPNFASTDPNSANFLRLSAGSPAIDRGVNVGLPYNGSNPDLGAYEK